MIPTEEASASENTPVTVQELDALVKTIFETRIKIEEQEKVVSELNKELANLKAKGVAYLKELGRDSYKTEYGTISILERWRVGLPQTDADKAALLAHLKERGIFDKYVTVNANSLNSLYMADWEDAKERGEGMTFGMPGIGEPKLFEDLGMRKR